MARSSVFRRPRGAASFANRALPRTRPNQCTARRGANDGCATTAKPSWPTSWHLDDFAPTLTGGAFSLGWARNLRYRADPASHPMLAPLARVR